MRTTLFFIPIVLSLVVLGAHFMRFGSPLGVVGTGLLLGLLFLRRPWVARLVQIALVLGTIEWLHTLFEMVQLRVAFGQPYTRLAIILASVAAITLCSALLFQAKVLKKIYRL